jgi:hypothetical protein
MARATSWAVRVVDYAVAGGRRDSAIGVRYVNGPVTSVGRFQQ